MVKFFVWFFRVIRNKKVMKHIPDGVRMLDIGCGSDFYLLRGVSGRIKSGTGMDIAVKNHTEKNLTIRKARIGGRLPFKSGSFDTVTMIAFIEHITNPGKMLKECNRVLEKGGKIIITTPMPRARVFWEALVGMGMTEEKTTKEHVHYFSPEEIEKLLKDAGFRVLLSKKFEFGMNYMAVGKKI
ncbi:MAG TPA: class I SAM-dependent methyltransferase [archaeon]|nr:class I SAM-dependent methyltransferase [archaeon]